MRRERVPTSLVWSCPSSYRQKTAENQTKSSLLLPAYTHLEDEGIIIITVNYYFFNYYSYLGSELAGKDCFK